MVAEAMEAHLREMERAGRDAEYRKHSKKAVERLAAKDGFDL